jgi:hypothetical protein
MRRIARFWGGGSRLRWGLHRRATVDTLSSSMYRNLTNERPSLPYYNILQYCTFPAETVSAISIDDTSRGCCSADLDWFELFSCRRWGNVCIRFPAHFMLHDVGRMSWFRITGSVSFSMANRSFRQCTSNNGQLRNTIRIHIYTDDYGMLRLSALGRYTM